TGQLMRPMGELLYDKAIEYFSVQARALAEGGADGIHIETMSDLLEVKAAIVGAKQSTNLPVTATMSFDMHGRTMMGVQPEKAVKEISELDIDAIGVNCGRTLDENLTSITAMRTAAPTATLIAKPNAGLPKMDGNVEAVYDVTPEIMADYALKFAKQHVKMLGACCGSTPVHITAVKEALANYEQPPLDVVLAENEAALAVAGGEGGQKERRRGNRRRR
ncbi:MAG: homocysteine S-methyltransferase family protein, partial [Chloroflexota bacterium]